eukprot:3881819-Amphidinium_carterae.1
MIMMKKGVKKKEKKFTQNLNNKKEKGKKRGKRKTTLVCQKKSHNMCTRSTLWVLPQHLHLAHRVSTP